MAVTVRLAPPRAQRPHALEGFGGQFNTNLFTRAGQAQDLTARQLADLRATIDDLKLGHSRIFIRRGLRPELPQGKSAPEFVALMNTIELAQASGAPVNLTWWGQGPYGNAQELRALKWPNRRVSNWPQPSLRKWPVELTDPAHPNAVKEPRLMMQRFALIIEEARRRGFDCVTHLTIQNEVNDENTDIAMQGDPGLSMRFYELLYRHLDARLKALPDPNDPSRTLRESIRIVGGDLVERKLAPKSHQDAWLKYMHANMEVPRENFPSVIDGYSIHVYWQPDAGAEGFPDKPETRIKNLEQTIRNLPSKRPVYVTEYGVRKLGAKPQPGTYKGKKLEHSPEAAFQYAWFNALAPQYGCVGLAKWVLYRTDIIRDGWGEWGMIDAPKSGFQRSPTYRVTRLFNSLIGPGWTAAGLGRSPAAGLLASKFAGPGGNNESVVVLNNSPQSKDVRVAGLKARRRYHRVDWNRDGTGRLEPLASVTSDAGGAATVTVAGHGVVALSTRSLGI